MSSANKITLLRVALLPALVFFLVRDTPADAWAALGIFLLAASTDWLDGYVARSRGQVTVLGKLLDPAADKLLMTAAILPLVRRAVVPDWMAVLLLGREFVVSGLRGVASAEGVIIAAGTAGKWKMGVSIAAISFLIAHHLHWARGIGNVLLWCSLALSLGSAAHYFYAYRHALLTKGGRARA